MSKTSEELEGRESNAKQNWMHAKIKAFSLRLKVNSKLKSYCVKLSGENLSRYSNKVESGGLSKCPYYHYLTKEVTSQ